jgi:hypothetical protein
VTRSASKLEARCSSCRRGTKHKVLREAKVSHTRHDAQYEAAYGEDIYWVDVFQIVQCIVCDEVGFRRVTWFNPTEEWQGLEEFPSPTPRDLPAWHVHLPPLVRSLAIEVYRAMAEDSRRLALMGARTLLDMLANEHVGDVGSFEKKVEKLVETGLVTPLNRTALLAAIDAGSAAVHRGHQPSTEDLDRVFDVVETILSSIYHLPGAAAELRTSTPPRPPRQKKP